eukprot:364325-Chlamydomonas_euryale.AAC.2
MAAAQTAAGAAAGPGSGLGERQRALAAMLSGSSATPPGALPSMRLHGFWVGLAKYESMPFLVVLLATSNTLASAAQVEL